MKRIILTALVVALPFAGGCVTSARKCGCRSKDGCMCKPEKPACNCADAEKCCPKK